MERPLPLALCALALPAAARDMSVFSTDAVVPVVRLSCLAVVGLLFVLRASAFAEGVVAVRPADGRGAFNHDSAMRILR